MSPAITAGQLKRLADQMAHLNAARDIPTGELYRSIAEDQYNKVRQEFQAAVDAALTAAEAQPVQEPVACQHKRQKWAINMRTGSCSDCGATFVFGRNGEPEKWSAPAAAPPQPVPLPSDRQPYGDLRNAKWLDPECYGAGACQSLKFKAQPVPLTDEQIDAGIEAWFTTDITTNEGKDKGHPFRQRMRAAIERAHGIGGKS